MATAPRDQAVTSPFSVLSSDCDNEREHETYFDEENHGSSALEYSDDTQEKESKTKFRSRRVVQFDDEAVETHQQQQQSSSRKPSHSHHHKHSNNNNNRPSWMTRWAYSFRSPIVGDHHKHPLRTHYPKKNTTKPHRHHRRTNSANMQEYPHYQATEQQVLLAHGRNNNGGNNINTAFPPPPRYDSWETGLSLPDHEEGRPLLWIGQQQPHFYEKHNNSQKHKTLLAAALLHDYEASRPPTFGGCFLGHNNSVDNNNNENTTTNIQPFQLTLYSIRFSWAFFVLRFLAVTALFVSSFMENNTSMRSVVVGCNAFSIFVLAVDVWIKAQLRTTNTFPQKQQQQQSTHVRVSRSEKLVLPLILFLLVFGLETLARWLVVREGNSMALFSSLFKPLVLFYVSSQARDALAAVRRILKIVVRVLVMELLLILMFAAVACRLFSDYDDFSNLYVAWLSLFELSTTVVNPSVWMPMYHDSAYSAIFFVLFIVVNVFYVHSLVLSVVFQTYIQAATEIHERNSSDREDAVHLAFQALLEEEQDADDQNDSLVDVQAVRETLQRMRPHYSAMKINALVEIVDPSNQGAVDFASFRTKIRQALNASIRTPRNASVLSMTVELVAVVVAISNFAYVILLSSPFEEEWWSSVQIRVGCIITLIACFELIIRFNPFRIPDFTPLTRLNATFDGLALVAALVSSVGMALYFCGRRGALEFVLMGRAIDMIRAMRFFQIFRDIVRRTSDVIPALEGPMILVATALHMFVYLGMALWSGAIEVGMHGDVIPDLYDLNNFNSYQEGIITMFQILVVNDWYLIAEIFLYGTRRASPFVVYPFFVSAILVNVSVMLNVLTAFFVESFVTKLNDDKDGPAEATTTMHKDFHIQSSERNFRRVSSTSNLGSSSKHKRRSQDASFDRGADADSEGSSESELFEFDVYEREGYDKIMQTVSGVQSVYEGDYARRICNYLEIFESLSPGRETVGYLICDQQTLERFGNRRFKTKSIGFLDENKLHGVVTDMHAELLALASRANVQERSLIRSFPHRRDNTKMLEISASLLRRHPALSIFVSRTITIESAGATPSALQNRRR